MEKLNDLTQKIWFSSVNNTAIFNQAQENLNVPDSVIVASVLAYKASSLDMEAIDEDDVADFKIEFLKELNGEQTQMSDTLSKHLDLL